MSYEAMNYVRNEISIKSRDNFFDMLCRCILIEIADLTSPNPDSYSCIVSFSVKKFEKLYSFSDVTEISLALNILKSLGHIMFNKNDLLGLNSNSRISVCLSNYYVYEHQNVLTESFFKECEAGKLPDFSFHDFGNSLCKTLEFEDFRLPEYTKRQESEHIIYCLVDQNEVVYVGCSSNILERKKQHKKDKIFDHLRVIEYIDSDKNSFEYRSFMEGLYIFKFKPRYNKAVLNGGFIPLDESHNYFKWGDFCDSTIESFFEKVRKRNTPFLHYKSSNYYPLYFLEPIRLEGVKL